MPKRPPPPHVPQQVRIRLRSGAEAFVTSRYGAGEFFVTPDMSLAFDAATARVIDQSWTAAQLCAVTHVSGIAAPIFRDLMPHSVMHFRLACCYAEELAKRSGVVLVVDGDAPAGDRKKALEASDAALAEYLRMCKRYGASGRKAVG